MNMIGMSFGSFLTLLIIGLIATIVMHWVIRYRALDGIDGFFAKWIAGWIGGWLGVPVLGHWWFQIRGEYVIPALVGAFVGAFTCVAIVKAATIANVKATEAKTVAVSAAPEVMRRAS